MTIPGVVADGITDDYPVIQAALDAASATNSRVLLPPGDIFISHPLLIDSAKIKLSGSPDGETRIFGGFAGHAVLAQAPRAFGPVLGPSVVPGPGSALRLVPGGPSARKPVVVTTEPNLDLAGAAEFGVSCFIERESPAQFRGVHYRFGGVYGHRSFAPLGLWDWDGGLALEWGRQIYPAPGWALDVGAAYHVAVSYKGGVVRLWVGTPGQTAALARTFSSPNPFNGGGVEVLSFGTDVNGPLGDQAAWGGTDGWLDGFEVSRVGADGPFACPAQKPVPGAQTRFLMNFETDGPYLVGHSTGGRKSYVLPNSPQTHMGGVEVSDLTFMGLVSGPCLYDCIYSKFRNLEVVESYVGYYLRGTTYGGVFSDLRGNAETFAWVQGDQSMQTQADSLKLGSVGRGVIFYAAGAVGGSYRGLNLTPHAPCVASAYTAETFDFNVDSGHVDDEEQAGAVGSVWISDRKAWPKFRGFNFLRTSPGPAIDLCRGGSVHFCGAWVRTPDQAEPHLNFRDSQEPVVKAGGTGLYREPAAVPLTNRPLWADGTIS